MIKSIASGSSGNCHVIDDKIMLDCGIHIDKIRKYVDLVGLSGCLASHSHMDHSKSVKALLDASVEVYMDKATSEELELNHHRLHIIEPLKIYKLGEWKFKGFPTVHDSAGGLGFLLRKDLYKIAYITDTEKVNYSFKGLTHLMIEANYSWQTIRQKTKEGTVNRARKARTIENHLSLEDVVNFLHNSDRSRLQEIRLLHLSNDNADQELFKQEVEEEFGIPVKVAPRRLK